MQCIFEDEIYILIYIRLENANLLLYIQTFEKYSTRIKLITVYIILIILTPFHLILTHAFRMNDKSRSYKILLIAFAFTIFKKGFPLFHDN